jgi:23S rRNA pseudouridine1911/1915/1917 synthase
MSKSITHQLHVLRYPEAAPQRVDQFLAQHFSDISRAYLQTILAQKKVWINNAVAKKGSMLAPQDEIRIEPFVHPDDRRLTPNDQPTIQVLHEEEHFIVINKPAGLPTHPNEFEDIHTVANQFIGLFPEAIEVGEDPLRPGIVHRLDTDTSGLLLLARTQDGFKALREKFDQRQIHKTYAALCMGHPEPQNQTIDYDVAHHPKNIRKMVALVDDTVAYRSTPRNASTVIHTVEQMKEATFLWVQTLTGRMHQVRIHLTSIGHPLIGDKLYQTHAQRQKDRSGLKRHFLHASHLWFVHPWTGQRVSFECNLAPELVALCEKWGMQPDLLTFPQGL